MCGIAGKVHFDLERDVAREEILAMLAPMHHRGPDGQGVYLDGPVGLGHLRLSIIDLEGGRQPLSNEDESVWIVFNGEIYNYQALREQLIARGHQFKTQSDTEVIVHLYEDFGPACVEQLRGMFAFAIWDQRKRRLFLARDRVGIKPLYYTATKGALAFASELKGLLALPEVSRALDEDAVGLFWCFQYLPGQTTLFRDIVKLLPGHHLLWEPGRPPVVQPYWDLHFPAEPRSISLRDAAEELVDLLGETVRLHMIADVPVGILLSGGMDSSAVLSFAARQSTQPLHTFTLGFDGQGVVDERPFARLVAERYGTRHYETTISCEQFWDYLPRLLWHLEEPVCEAPAVALHFVSELARSQVKVVLSGEGGDEAFGGYPNYPNTLVLEKVRALCGPLAPLAAKVLGAAARTCGWPRVGRYAALLPFALEDRYWSRVGEPRDGSGATDPGWFQPDFAARYRSTGKALMHGLFQQVAGAHPLHRMLYVDTKTWLPDDLLIKADKVTMGNSIELRVPLLDHKVLEFAAQLPAALKVRGRETKRVLKAAMASVVPPEVVKRRKAGFPVPYGRWLAHELLPRTREMLLDSHSWVSTFFRRDAIEKLLIAHARTEACQRDVMALLVLEMWHQQFGAAHNHGLAASQVI